MYCFIYYYFLFILFFTLIFPEGFVEPYLCRKIVQKQREYIIIRIIGSVPSYFKPDPLNFTK